MIRCSKCGTLNRDNSRFCNECGAALQHTEIRCPNCGAMNPVGNVFCDKCHARLMPTTGLKPPPPMPEGAEHAAAGLKSISLPTRSAEAAPADTELPNWLLELSDAGPASSQTEAAGDVALPDWLSGLGEGEPADAPAPTAASSSAELPDWLTALAQEAPLPVEPPAAASRLAQPAGPTPSATEAPLPDWLSGLAAPGADAVPSSLADWLSAPEEETPTETAPAAPRPDWMSEWGETELESPAEVAQPDWLRDLIAPEPAPPARKPAQPPAPTLPESGLPDWLSSFSTTESDAEEAETTAPSDWLSGLVPAEPAEEPEAGPDWLRGIVEEEPAEAPAQPDWLSGLITAEPEESAEPEWSRGVAAEEPAEASAQRDWLSGLMFTEPVEEEVLELDWAHGVTDEEPAEAETSQPGWAADFGVTEPAEEEALELDWAHGISEEEPAEEEPSVSPPRAFAGFIEEAMVEAVGGVSQVDTAPARPLPDWLNAITDPSAPPPSARSSEIPAWLLRHADPTAPPAALGLAPLPNWLLLNVEAPSAVPAQSKPPSAPPPMAPGAPAPARPDWLSELGVEEEAAAAAETPAAPTLPDWISGLGAEEEATEKPAAPEGGEPEEVELPDWLAGAAEVEEVREGLPDWLAAAEGPEEARPAAIFEEEAPEPAAELPDWLGGAAPSAPPAPPAAVFTEAPEVAEIPDWLKAVESAEPSPAEKAPGRLAARRLREAAPKATPSEAALPDWLANIAEEAPAAPPAAPAFVPGVLESGITKPPAPPREEVAPPEEAPSWLDALVSAEEEAPPVTEIPLGDDLARANVPTWLQQLRPSGTGPLPPLPPEIAGILGEKAPEVEAASGLARAEIPEWVQQLRPTVTSTGEVVSEKYLGPAEESGPLAGLAGVIIPLTAVDIPPDFVPVPLPQPSEAIVQQAQLWQQLLEQPRGKARPVTQQRGRPGLGARLLRMGVMLLLLAAAAVGLLWSDESLGQAPPPAARPGVKLLHDSVRNLQPGDTVILTVDYGPAEAVEMQPIAETLLDQLAERQVNVIAVSTLPEGAGMIQALLASRAMTNALPAAESVYRVGADSGIADLLNRGEALGADMVLVVAARLEPMRGWIEQNAAARRPLPLAVSVNAANGAFIMPYFETRGLNGWLVGITDLATYRQIAYQGEFAQLGTLDLARVLNAMVLTHWAAAGLLFFGLLYAVAARKKGAR